MQNLVQQFQQFKSTMQGKDAKGEVEKLIQSGQMTPQQFEQLKKMAQSMSWLIK